MVILNVKKASGEWVVQVTVDGKRESSHDYHAGAGDKDAKLDAVGSAQAMGVYYKAQGHDIEIRSK